jgi:hypothetical protein
MIFTGLSYLADYLLRRLPFRSEVAQVSQFYRSPCERHKQSPACDCARQARNQTRYKARQDVKSGRAPARLAVIASPLAQLCGGTSSIRSVSVLRDRGGIDTCLRQSLRDSRGIGREKTFSF